MDVEIEEPFGGIHGICWRSRYRLNLSQTRNIMSLEDTEFIFDITKLISINTESTNEIRIRSLMVLPQEPQETLIMPILISVYPIQRGTLTANY